MYGRASACVCACECVKSQEKGDEARDAQRRGSRRDGTLRRNGPKGEEREGERARRDNLTTVYRRWSWLADRARFGRLRGGS